MVTSAPESSHVLRLTVRIHAEEFPLLMQALLQCGKGRRRAARLAHLAAIGLLSERQVTWGPVDPRASAPAQDTSAMVITPPQTEVVEENALTSQQLCDLLGLDPRRDQDA